MTSCGFLPPALWNRPVLSTLWYLPEDTFLHLPISKQKQERRRTEVWIHSTREKLTMEEWTSSLILNLCFPASSLLFCSSLWTGIFHIRFSLSPAPCYPLIYSFNRGLELAKARFIERGMESLRCTIKNGFLLGMPGPGERSTRKETPPHLLRPPSKVPKAAAVLPVHYLALSACEHFRSCVFKGTANFSETFPLTPTMSK